MLGAPRHPQQPLCCGVSLPAARVRSSRLGSLRETEGCLRVFTRLFVYLRLFTPAARLEVLFINPAVYKLFVYCLLKVQIL